MLAGAIVFFVAAAALVIMGISFIVDISHGVGPGLAAATVDSRNPRRTYTFFRVESRGVAWFVTILTFILAAGAVGGGIAMLVI